jgi:hypothetical protein
MPALSTSLYVTACLFGTLHGEPRATCKEFQVARFESIATCTVAAPTKVEEWLLKMHTVGIDTQVVGFRCGPTEAEKDGDDT